MYQSIRSAPQITIAAFVLGLCPLSVIAQPGPPRIDTSGAPKPAQNGGPAVTAPGQNFNGPPIQMMKSPSVDSILSPEELQKYTAFQQQLNDDPAIKELNAKIVAVNKELHQLQAESRALHEKLLAANPEIKAIRDKIMTAAHVRTGTGPGPIAVPAKSN